MKPIALATVSLFLLLSPAAAQEVCPCVPVTHAWVVTPCESWNCAAAAVVLANGDRNVMPMPTTESDFTWIVLRRVAAGSSIIVPNPPFTVSTFDSLTDAASHFYTLDAALHPILVTATDGKVLVVVRASSDRRRAVPH
jgi:hypothetical protein